MGLIANRRRCYCGKKILLPSGYRQIEYIECTGTQYINTGLYPNTITTKFKGAFLGKNTSLCGVLGSRNSATNKSKETCAVWSTDSSFIRVDWATQVQNTKLSIPSGEKFTIEISAGYCILNGDTYNYGQKESYDIDCEFLIGCINNDGKLTARFIGNVYKCALYNNGILIMELVPCIDPQNQVGMFDLVSQTFFGNSGTGSFIDGPEV